MGVFALKTYQTASLDALRAYLVAARLLGPKSAFDSMDKTGVREPRPYRPLPGLEKAPYVCLRLPTGGGKTLLAARRRPARKDWSASRAATTRARSSSRSATCWPCNARWSLWTKRTTTVRRSVTRLLQRANAACVVEFTATPANDSNILHNVSATELKAEDTIKLPIRMTENKTWEEAVRDPIINRRRLGCRGGGCGLHSADRCFSGQREGAGGH